MSGKHRWSRGVLLAAVLALGCGSESEPAPPPGEPELDFARVTSEVINRTNCSGALCHDTAATGAFMLGTMDQLYSALVDQPAAGPECASSGLTRVVPFDSANSLLYRKISHDPNVCGDAMPLARLPDDKIELVRRWIDEGAVR